MAEQKKIPITVAVSMLKRNLRAEVATMRQNGLPAFAAVGALEAVLTDMLKEQAAEVEADYQSMIDQMNAEGDANGI